MKTNTNKKNSATKKLIPAISMLTVSAMMLSTATYAWFTMNKEVSVTGMTLKTKVDGNLLICETNEEADYTTEVLDQTRAARLEPVSTIKGTDGSFYYTVNALGNGDAVDDDYELYAEATNTNATATALGKSYYDSAFNDAYGFGATPGYTTQYDTAYGYVDYTFYLKATGDDADQYIKMTKCDLLYDDGQVDTAGTVGSDVDKAWRVAVFAEDITSAHPGDGNTSTAVTETADTAQTILTISGAHTQNYDPSATPTPVGEQAVKDDDELANVTYNTWTGTDNTIGIVSSGGTKYFKVVVRVWLEGEDTTCTSKTYAQLTDAWTLDLGFTLAGNATTDNNTAVTAIGTPTP